MTRDALSSTARQTGPLSPNYRLIYERQQLNLTQDELAAQIGATKASIIRWEHGHLPSPYYRKQLCAFFGKSMQDLGWTAVEAERTEEGAIQATLGVTRLEPYVQPSLAPPLPLQKVIGREAMLAALKEQLFNHKSLALSALDGLPGVGKTTLAIALAHDPQVQEHFPDGVLWAGLGRKADVLQHLGRWGMALGISRYELEKLPDIPSRQQRLRAIMAERKLLLVADDVWERAVALELMVGGEQCAFLITTRLPTVAEYIAPESILLVHELSEDDGLALLGQLAPQAVKAAPEEALRLVRAVGGLPLALILVGKYLRGRVHSQQTTRQKQRNLQSALERLQQIERRVLLAGRPDTPEIHPSLHPRAMISLEAVIAMSDEVLEPAPRELLRALSAFPPKPNTFSEEAALAVGAASASTLDLLTNAGLLEGLGEDRHALHQTIADYAHAKRSDTRAEERMAEYFAMYVETHETDYNALEQEMSNIMAALQVAFDRGKQAMLIRGANAFNDFLQTRGLYSVAEMHLKRAAEASRFLNDDTGLAKTLLHLGEIATNRGDYGEAEVNLQEGLLMARRIDSSELSSKFLRVLGWLASGHGNYKQAEAYLQEGLNLARQSGSLDDISALLRNLGSVALNRGEYPRAAEYLQEALDLARQIGHYERMCAILTSLGILHVNQGDYKQAEVYYQEGLRLARLGNFHERSCALLTNLGTVYATRGDKAQAEAYWQEGQILARQSGHREIICSLLQNLGELAIINGDYPLAEKYSQEGLDLARQIGHPERICTLLQNLSALESHRLNYERSEIYLRECLDLARQIEHRWLIDTTLLSWGELYLKRQQLDLASAAFIEVLGIDKGISQEMAADARYGLARVALARGKEDEALFQGEACLAIFEVIGHRKTAEVRQWMAALSTVKKDIEL